MFKLSKSDFKLGRVYVLLCTFVLVGASVAQAEDQSSGCGLGWKVTQRMSLVSSSIRSTTNEFLPNTFSMTSGTSGCAQHEIVKNDAKAVEFAVMNYDSLVQEMAEGRGEYLKSFGQTLGCNSAALDRFNGFTQARYHSISEQSGGDSIRFYQAVRTEMQGDQILGKSCVPAPQA